MERLWAPWRMTYILGEPSGGCFFCEGSAGDDDRGSLILYRGERCFIIMNRFPYNNGHLLVAPYRHVGNMEDLNQDESLDLMKLLQASIVALREELGPDGFNVGINIGKTGGAGVVDHIHLHIVPRWNGDTNFMPVLSQTKIISEALEKTYDKLWNAFHP